MALTKQGEDRDADKQLESLLTQSLLATMPSDNAAVNVLAEKKDAFSGCNYTVGKYLEQVSSDIKQRLRA